MSKRPDTEEGSGGESLHVLLVEDNQDHSMLIVDSLEELVAPEGIHHVSDGKEALDYLHRQGDYSDAVKSPRPSLILLDLRLPKIGGLEVLRQIKTSEELHRIPVVIFSTSKSEMDICEAYDNHANSYLVKSVDPDEFYQVILDMGRYWLTRNQRPPQKACHQPDHRYSP